MAFITPKATNDLVRAAPNLLAPKIGYLTYGKIYQAVLQGGWYFIESIRGYSHYSVVREVPDPAIPRPPVPPLYLSEWDLEANARQSDCGPTGLAMHARARGDMTPVNQYRTVNATGLTDAPELQKIAMLHNMVTVIERGDPLSSMADVPRYSMLLIDYGYLPRNLVQDVRFHDIHGWHWLIFWGIDPDDPTMAITLDPDYWGTRRNEGNMKRYPVAALRQAFRPYGANKTTTALVFPDLQGGGIPLPVVYTSRYVDSPFPLGINVHSGPAISTPIIGNGFANGDLVAVDLASLVAPEGYVRERRGGWIALQYLSETPPVKVPPPAPAPVRKWKLGFHVVQSDNTQFYAGEFKRLHDKGLLALLTIVNDINLANTMCEYGIPYVVHRAVNDGNEAHEHLSGNVGDVSRGAACFNSPSNHLGDLNPRVIIQMYGCNEQNRPLNGQPDGWFYKGAMEAADAEGKGRKLVIFNDSVGNPDIAIVNGRVISKAWSDRKLSGVMAHAFAHKHFVGNHCYGSPECEPGAAIYPDGHRDDNQFYWYADRWRAGYSLMADDEKPIILGTECGLFCAGYKGRDWLFNDMVGYQARYGGERLIAGISYWTLGNKGGWEFSDYTRDLAAVYDHFIARKP